MKTPPTPGQRFKAARHADGLSQAEAARWIGVAPSAVCDFECGRRTLLLETLHAWCTACDIDPGKVDARLARLPANR